MNTIHFIKKTLKFLSVCGFLAVLSGCGSISQSGTLADAIPKTEPLSKYGNPSSYVIAGKRYYVMKSAKGYDKTGNASWYGMKFHGHHTSSREPYNMYSMTAASPVLPIPSYVRVTNLQNGQSAIVKVNDRGPFKSNRIIDLSYAAAKKLGYANEGTAKVRVTALDVSTTVLLAQNTVQSPSVSVFSSLPDLTKTAPKSTQVAQATYLQVGAFGTRTVAEKVVKQLTHLPNLNHVQVALKETNRSGTHIYRVHIGPLESPSLSQQLTQLLSKYGFDKAMMVRG